MRNMSKGTVNDLSIGKMQVILSPVLIATQMSRMMRQLDSEIVVYKKEYSSLPKAPLYIRDRDGHTQFSKRENGCTKGITSDMDTVYKLARRQYLELSIDLIEQLFQAKSKAAMEKIVSDKCAKIEKLLQKYEEAGLDLDLITMTPDQRVWNSDRHSKSNYRREDLKYPTRRGRVYMRSKSEQLIGNLLEELHIPYRYEPEVRINNRMYHPDFVIMMPNGRLIILEHAGRMDLQEYREILVQRLQAYDSIGLLIGRNVFISFEHDTKDEALTKEVIFQMLTSDPVKNRILQSVAVRAGCKFGAA